MADGPHLEPVHLRPADASARSWLTQRAAAVAAVVLGLVTFIAAALSQDALWSTPDLRITVPGFVLTALAGVASLARREPGAAPLWLLGLGLAGVALALGWFLLVTIVVGVTAIGMLILHTLM
jgi:hypothetical protein